MRYLPKNISEAAKEDKAVKLAMLTQKSEQEIEKIRKFVDYNCNMNHLCHYAEKQVADIDAQYEVKANDYIYKFDYHKYMLRSCSSIKRDVFRMVKILQDEYREITKKYRKESMKSKTHQKTAANKFRWFYDKCRVELLMLEPDIEKLIDMLVIIYYGDKRNGSEFLGFEKDVLWNTFPNELIERCCDENISTNLDYDKLEERHRKNVENAKKQKDIKLNRKRVIIKSIENNDEFKNKSVLLTKKDRLYINNLINKAYKDKLIKRMDNVYKMKRILAILVFLSRKFEKGGVPQWIKKMDNVPDEITDITLEGLTSVGHKNMDLAIALFEQMGILDSKIVKGGVKIKLLFSYNDGDVWIEADDYNNAGAMIRDYFRVDKEKRFLEGDFREKKTKIS